MVWGAQVVRPGASSFTRLSLEPRLVTRGANRTAQLSAQSDFLGGKTHSAQALWQGGDVLGYARVRLKSSGTC